MHSNKELFRNSNGQGNLCFCGFGQARLKTSNFFLIWASSGRAKLPSGNRAGRNLQKFIEIQIFCMPLRFVWILGFGRARAEQILLQMTEPARRYTRPITTQYLPIQEFLAVVYFGSLQYIGNVFFCKKFHKNRNLQKFYVVIHNVKKYEVIFLIFQSFLRIVPSIFPFLKRYTCNFVYIRNMQCINCLRIFRYSVMQYKCMGPGNILSQALYKSQCSSVAKFSSGLFFWECFVIRCIPFLYCQSLIYKKN